jgi:hypothetical protein
MIPKYPSAAKNALSRRQYTKKDVEQLDSLIKDIQTDPKRVRLFQILNHQLELLINERRSNPHSLFISLKAEIFVSEEEYREFRANFVLETVS